MDPESVREPSRMRTSTDHVVDTSEFSNDQRENMIINKRGAFAWLPVWHDCDRGPINDLEVGSWYFVWGSVIWFLFPIIPIIDIYHPLFPSNEDNDDVPLPMAENIANFILVMLSGVLFTIGSLFFVRSFWEPKLESFFENLGGCCLEHFGTDEQTAAWFFFFGTVPAFPISIMYIYFNPSAVFNWFSCFCSLLLLVGTYLFVLAVYPEIKEEKSNQIFPSYLIPLFGKDSEVLYHAQNNWLVGCWIFYWGTLLSCVIAAFLVVSKFYARNYFDCYIFAVTFFDCVMFTIGSMYFVSGSYPMTDKILDNALADSEAPRGESKNADVHSKALVDVFSPVVADDENS